MPFLRKTSANNKNPGSTKHPPATVVNKARNTLKSQIIKIKNPHILFKLAMVSLRLRNGSARVLPKRSTIVALIKRFSIEGTEDHDGFPRSSEMEDAFSAFEAEQMEEYDRRFWRVLSEFHEQQRRSSTAPREESEELEILETGHSREWDNIGAFQGFRGLP